MSKALSEAPTLTADLAPDRGTQHRPTIALFIPSLDIGGAERQAIQLASELDPMKWRVLLLTMADLQGRKGVAAVRELAAILAKERVDILQAFLLGAQMYALSARVLYRRAKLVAAVRSSMGREQIVGWKGKISHTLVFNMRGLVNQYVFNSYAGEHNVGRHVPSDRKRVIANGIDTDRFRPDLNARRYLEEIADVSREAMIVGMIANINVDKAYETFVRAAAIVVREKLNVCFVVIGDYHNPLGDRIRALMTELSLASHFRYLGSRRDVERIVPGMDVVCSASTSEGFSNSVAEAMACGVPCVVTAVGDSELIVGETGLVVPPNDAAALASGLLRLLLLEPTERRKLGDAARERIVRHFALRQMIERYETLYESLLQER